MSNDRVYWVDIPTDTTEEDENYSWKNVGKFASRQEAIDYAKEHFGADDEGKVCLVV